MIVVYHVVKRWWRARQRRIDMDILWPLCLEGAGNLDNAKAAFATHCFLDPAWRELGETGIIAFIDKLEAYD